MTLSRCVLLGLVVGLATGCESGDKPPPQAAVKGRVTFDAKPVDAGQILFDGGDGRPPTTLPITAGGYEGQVPVGRKTVRISAYRDEVPKGASGPGADVPQKVNIIPPKYNRDSTTTKEVAAGENTFDFDLTK